MCCGINVQGTNESLYSEMAVKVGRLLHIALHPQTHTKISPISAWLFLLLVHISSIFHHFPFFSFPGFPDDRFFFNLLGFPPPPPQHAWPIKTLVIYFLLLSCVHSNHLSLSLSFALQRIHFRIPNHFFLIFKKQ